MSLWFFVETHDLKIRNLLDDDSYAKIDSDPTNKMEKKVNNELKKLSESGEINKTMYNKMRTTFSNAPKLYRLPKIHKPDVPLRPIIVSTIGSATYYLAKELTKIISPLAGT